MPFDTKSVQQRSGEFERQRDLKKKAVEMAMTVSTTRLSARGVPTFQLALVVFLLATSSELGFAEQLKNATTPKLSKKVTPSPKVEADVDVSGAVDEALKRKIPTNFFTKRPTKTPDLLSAIRLRDGDDSLAKSLLSKGADPFLKDEYGNSILFLAVSKGLSETTRELLRLGVSAHQVDHVGQSPLFYAVDHNLPNVVDILLENLAVNNPAMVDFRNTKGATVLRVAVALAMEGGRKREDREETQKRVDIIGSLLAAGANPFVLTKTGQTLISTALESGNLALAAVFGQYLKEGEQRLQEHQQRRRNAW